jgi:hypothetical protein
MKKHDAKEVNNPISIVIMKRKVRKCIEKPIAKRMMLINSLCEPWIIIQQIVKL